LLVPNAEAVEAQCFHSIARGHDPRFWLVSGGSVHDLANAECIAPRRNTAQMVSDLTPVGMWHGVLRSRGAFYRPLKIHQRAQSTAECRRQTKTTIVFGIVVKSIAYHVPLAEWEAHADRAFQWAQNTVIKLYERDVPDSPPPEHISTEEVKRIYGLALNKGKFTKEAFKVWLKERGYDGLGKILKPDYKNLCDAVSDPSVGRRYNAKV
jgi:hypothetical protein